MSTTTVSFRSTTRDTELEALRQREAEAREAARRAAQRAEEQRRREEAIRLRIAAANRSIAEQEGRFQRAVARLDEAARCLPDLALTAPTLPALDGEITQDPAKLEAYATHLAAEVEQFGRQLDIAIAEAERLLQRRIAKAAAWRTAADLVQELDVRTQAIRDAAARLHESMSLESPPVKPQAEAELEAVEAYVAALQQRLIEANRQIQSLNDRLESRRRASALAGAEVQTQSADTAHARFEAERVAAAQAALRARLDAAMSSARMRFEELPESLRALIDDALAQAHVQDQGERVTRWIARQQQRRDGVARALSLMQQAPDLVHDDPALSRRWSSLLAQFQRVAGGLDDFTPSIEHEYAQLCADAQCLLNTAFTKADWVQAMIEQGFEIFEREDGQGLVVVDLDHPETWLEATELEAEQGGFAAVLELKTDAALVPTDEAAVTSDICAKLARAAGTAKPDVATAAEVIEQKPRITRGRRPAKAKKTFARGL